MPFFGTGHHRLITGDINYASDTIKMLLMVSGTAPVQTNEFVSDLTGEVTGGTYAPQTLTGKALVHDVANRRTILDADEPVFTGVPSGLTLGHVVTFKDTGNPATSPLIAWSNITLTTDGNNVRVTITDNDLLLFSYPAP